MDLKKMTKKLWHNTFFRSSKRKRIANLCIAFSIISIFITLIVQNIKISITNSQTTFSPSIIPLSAPELTNPWRGAYKWYDEPGFPGWPTQESYVRYTWRGIEPSEGQYDFSEIDRELALAQAQHGKFGLRIMPALVDNIAVPDYLVNLMPNGKWVTNTFSGKTAYEPDWNDNHYMARAEALIQALGERYNNDPRLGWVDIFPYGDWGEWHTLGFPSTIAPMSESNQQKLVDANIRAFSHKRLVMFTLSPDTLTYALSRSSKIGIRIDCLGEPDMGKAVEHLKHVPLAQERWKTAPVIFEFCKDANFQQALKQVEIYHGAMISNGNIYPYESYSFAQQQYLKQVFSTSGYRFILNSMTLPSKIKINTQFAITTKWSNANVTPAYNPWEIYIRLEKSTGALVWQGKSNLDLEKLLPTENQTTGINTPITVTDKFKLPDTIPTGKYSISIQILDPDNYFDPLNLGIQGRKTDGSYTLGMINVG